MTDCDQGADTFEFIEHGVASERRLVIRAAYDRNIAIGHGDPHKSEVSHLRTFAATLPVAGYWTLSVTSREMEKRPKRKGKRTKVKRVSRDAKLAVSFSPVHIKPPKKKQGEHGSILLKVWVIRVCEIGPPEEEKRLEWFLLTNENVDSFGTVYCVVGWYECRWIVEEYHKGMITGFRVESPQFTKKERLRPAIALIAEDTVSEKLRGKDSMTRRSWLSKNARSELTTQCVIWVKSVRSNTGYYT